MITQKKDLQNLKKQLKDLRLAGLDEVGRGSWAGPVVAASVVLKNPFTFFKGLNDSKQLSARKREELFHEILSLALDFGIGVSSHDEVDKLGLREATRLAHQRAIWSLSSPVDHVLIDGRDRFQLSCASTDLIRGDQNIACIAAASILAKVYRDALMTDLSQEILFYGFESHVGYGTKRHQEALRRYGPSCLHRLSYKPIQALYASC